MHKLLLEGLVGWGRVCRSIGRGFVSTHRSPTLTSIYSSAQCLHLKKDKDGHEKRRGDSLRVKKIAAQVLDVVGLAFQQGPYNSNLLLRCGMEISNVKMSSDLRSAYIFWSSSPGMQRTVEKELKIHVMRLRSMLFSELSMPFSPKIVFVEDKPNKHVQELEEALASIKERDSQA